MAEFDLANADTVTIRAKALNARIISGGNIKAVAPKTGRSIPGRRPSASIVEWQVPANSEAAYLLLVQMPRQSGVSLDKHEIERAIYQGAGDSAVQLCSSAANPKETHPSISLSNGQILYLEIIKFSWGKGR